MPQHRPRIPAALKREIRIEAGGRCAFPACRQWPVQFEHIEDWATVREHRFDNIILLCSLHHDMKTRGAIDRLTLKQLKANLSVINFRYGDVERRVLQAFADSPDATVVEFPNGFDVLLLFLLRDGYLEKMPFVPGLALGPSGGQPGFQMGLQQYRLTPVGREFVQKWLQASPLDPPEGDDEDDIEGG